MVRHVHVSPCLQLASLLEIQPVLYCFLERTLLVEGAEAPEAPAAGTTMTIHAMQMHDETMMIRAMHDVAAVGTMMIHAMRMHDETMMIHAMRLEAKPTLASVSTQSVPSAASVAPACELARDERVVLDSFPFPKSILFSCGTFFSTYTKKWAQARWMASACTSARNASSAPGPWH